MVNDGTRNLVGRINDDEFMMFELVEDFETAIFVVYHLVFPVSAHKVVMGTNVVYYEEGVKNEIK